MDDVFGPGGTLSTTLPGYEPRPEQSALADSVARALETGTHLLAEAGTGVGKSLAYLIPALESGRRVVVATATKALQEQLLVHDVPAAEAALGRELRVAVLKGRQNYLCRKSLQGLGLLGGALLRSDEDAALYEGMLPWIDATQTGDRAELDVEPPASLWNELAVGSDRCGGRRCAFFSTCFAEAARERAGEAELVIANHALYFADVALRGKSDGAAVLPDHDAVVFDEAHRLEESAATWLGGRVSAGGLNRLASDVERACREVGVAVPARALDGAIIAGDRLFGAVAPPSGRLRLREPPPDLVLGLAGALARLAEALAGRGEDLDGLARRAAGLAVELELCLDEAPDLERVVWAEPGALAWAPVDVSERLRELLWGAGPTAVLVSATLGLDGSFAFPRARLGIDEADELAVGSPYDFREQALLYLPRSLPDPRSPEALARIADEVVALCALSRGRALVLTTSYRALGEIAARARGRLPYPVLVQGEAPRERLLERFRERGRLGADRDLDVLARRRHSRRGAVTARDREASLLGSGRSAARGPLRADRPRRWRLVPRLRSADGRAPAPAGLRSADPRARRPRRRRRARPPAAHARVRPCFPHRAASCARRRGPCRGGGVLRPACGRGRCRRLLASFAVAKKTTTPPPPRRVQAPKVRTPDRGAGLDDRRRKQIVYGFGASGFIALIVVLLIIVLSGGSSASAMASKLKAAGCTYKQYAVPPPNGDMHVFKLTAKPVWVTHPPSGGQHYYTPAEFNFYDQAVTPVQATHNLEHGGVVIWYGPKISAQTKQQLRAFYDKSPVGLLVTPYAGLGSKIALSAWTANKNVYQSKHQIGYFGDGHFALCTGFNEKGFKAFAYTLRGHGPESQFRLQDLQPGS